jgi:hypothetical protein
MAIVRKSRAELDLSDVNWDRLRNTTDTEVLAQTLSDPDQASFWTESELKAARLVRGSIPVAE